MAVPLNQVGGFVAINKNIDDIDAVKDDDSSKATECTTERITEDITEDTTEATCHTDAGEQPEGPIDPLCKALHLGNSCRTNSGNHRKVISHVFGRNKTSTQQLPDDSWILWCRMHYQRGRYRDISLGVWHKRQLEIVRDQLKAFEVFDADQKWTIVLRKAAQDALNAESSREVLPAVSDSDTDCVETPACWERFLTPYLGSNKTFADIRDVLGVIDLEFNTPQFLERENKDKVFPGVEFLASSKEKGKKSTSKRKVKAPTPYIQSTTLTI